MLKYEIRSDGLWYGSRRIGDVDCIFVEATQADVRAFVEVSKSLAHPPRVEVCHLDVGDYVFATPSGKTVALEEKRSGDLARSMSEGRRRGRRQLRECRAAADVAGLALRGDYSRVDLDQWEYAIPSDMVLEIVKWQVLGGLVVPLPTAPGQLLEELWKLRAILRPGSHLYSVVAGTDKKMPWVGQPEPVLAFRRMVKGVGRSIGDAIWEVAKHKKDPLGWMVTCEDEELAEVRGVHRGIIEQRRKVKGR